MVERSANRERRRVTRLRYHADEAILREWTGCPTVIAILRPPLVNPRLVKMVRIQKRNQSIKVIQCPHGVMARLRPVAQQVQGSPRHRVWAALERRFPKWPAPKKAG